jgi:hypothetical protein
VLLCSPAADAINAQQLQPEPGNWEAQLLTAIKAALRADGKVCTVVLCTAGLGRHVVWSAGAHMAI